MSPRVGGGWGVPRKITAWPAPSPVPAIPALTSVLSNGSRARAHVSC